MIKFGQRMLTENEYVDYETFLCIPIHVVCIAMHCNALCHPFGSDPQHMSSFSLRMHYAALLSTVVCLVVVSSLFCLRQVLTSCSIHSVHNGFGLIMHACLYS